MNYVYIALGVLGIVLTTVMLILVGFILGTQTHPVGPLTSNGSVYVSPR